eukprot:g33527.t1
MTKVLRKLYGRDQPWMNVLSIGDSTVERAAVMEIMQLEDEVQEAEQAYYELNMLLTTAECKLQRAHWETRCLRKEEGATHSEEFATLSDQYAAEIAKLDEQFTACGYQDYQGKHHLRAFAKETGKQVFFFRHCIRSTGEEVKGVDGFHFAKNFTNLPLPNWETPTKWSSLSSSLALSINPDPSGVPRWRVDLVVLGS